MIQDHIEITWAAIQTLIKVEKQKKGNCITFKQEKLTPLMWEDINSCEFESRLKSINCSLSKYPLTHRKHNVIITWNI